MPAPALPRPSASAVRRAVVVAVAAGVALTGCSNRESPINKRPHAGTGSASAVGGVQQITVTTGNDYRFHPSTLVVHPGRVQITLVNDVTSGPPHNLSFTGLPGAAVPLISAGQSASTSFTAPAPGTYKFVCTIHVAQGQTGVLVVKSAGQ